MDKCLKSIVNKRVSIQGGNGNKKEVFDVIKKYASCIYISDNSYLMGAIGIALITYNSGIEKKYNIKIEDIKYDIKEIICEKCNSRCKMVCICSDNIILDYKGNKCNRKIDEIKI